MRRIASLFALFIGIVVLLATASTPRTARADPHAVFYTTKGQEQLFYNVLAALNQADYVEEPGRPTISAARKEGDDIAAGRSTDALGRPIEVTPEPNERLALPRIRVRTVTSDDGDVYYRELRYRKALAEKIRVELSNLSCQVQRIIYGDAVWEQCRPQSS